MFLIIFQNVPENLLIFVAKNFTMGQADLMRRCHGKFANSDMELQPDVNLLLMDIADNKAPDWLEKIYDDSQQDQHIPMQRLIDCQIISCGFFL